MCVSVFVFSQGGQLVGLMPVLAACHLIYVSSVVLRCISIHVVANKVLSLTHRRQGCGVWHAAWVFFGYGGSNGVTAVILA